MLVRVKDAHRTLRLLFIAAMPKLKATFYASEQQETRDISFLSHKEPVGLALASKGNACITWRVPGQEELTEVVLYGRDAKLMEAQEYGQSSVISHRPEQEVKILRNV